MNEHRNALVLLSALCTLSLLSAATASAQTSVIEGRVTSAESGHALSYANIQVVGTSLGALSREDGTFRIVGLEPGPARVQVTYIGYATVVEAIHLDPGQLLSLDFALEVEPIELPGVLVTALRLDPGIRSAILDRSYLPEVFATDGFSLIRKGSLFASDLYADGFKRGDITVTVDGERYPNACPNRMDPPTTRVNPLEVTTVELDKNSSSCGCGIGGQVSFQRGSPSQEWRTRGSISGMTLGSEDYDVAFAVDGGGYRATGRVARGHPFEDADGRDFTELYGYSQIKQYGLTEFSVYGERGTWEHGASLSFTEDVSFPYLRMDERKNELWNVYTSYRKNKLYVNHTYHVMDNAFRESPMLMETVARNLTVGLTGEFYEAYYRNWDSDNQFVTPMTRIENHLMPDLHLASVAASHALRPRPLLELRGLLGMQRQWLGDGQRLDFHRRYHPGAEENRLFLPFGITANSTSLLGQNATLAMLLEVASAAPSPEQLFIAVQKPTGKPSWSGNPKLNAPVRSSLRTRFRTRFLHVELFGTRVWDYVSLTRDHDEESAWMTFDNIDAWLYGVNLSAEWRALELRAKWNQGQNSTRDTPLAEIQPPQVSAKLKVPGRPAVQPYMRYTITDAQTRVDPFLNEEPTPSWRRLDLGVECSWRNLYLNCELENVSNERYYRHLSYLRDPFSAGYRVYEPSRTLRFRLAFDYN